MQIIVLLGYTVVLIPMALEQAKKGGPCNKSEQEERRRKVHDLYFVKGMSIIRIADTLGYNRNTISADVEYWYSVIHDDFTKHHVTSWTVKQLHRLEDQRFELMQRRDSIDDLDKKSSLDKMIIDVDYKISSVLLKIRGLNRP